MPRIHVDGVEYDVAEGRTILQALDDLGVLMNGVDIPHYCWHPKLSIDGSCRLCQVEVEGIPKLQIACNTHIANGMKIHTQSERVQNAREGVMELLLVNHPLDCPICDQAGECKLQDYAFEYGAQHARTQEPRRAGKKRVDLGPTIVFDQERCILCRRCVRFCREVPGTSELAVFARGDHSVIETFPDTPLDNDYSMNVADICPVGALTTKDFRFKIRVWFLEDVPGVCTGCANGCNVYHGVANNRVYRYTPRRNDAVNQTWLCDEGRLSYKRINAEDRIDHAAVRNGDGNLDAVPYESALAVAAARIQRVIDTKGGGAVGMLVSPHATNEDLSVAKQLLDALGSTQAGFALVRGRKDELLIKEEKAANAAGARALGFDDAVPLLERARGGAVEALIVMGQDVLAPAYAGGLDALTRVDTLVLLDTHRSHLESLAHVVLPARVAAEKNGTLTNFAGLVQAVEPAVEPAFEARSEGAALWRLGQLLGLAGFADSYEARPGA
jgi:NADH-quinone oxidoreductase subunit G